MAFHKLLDISTSHLTDKDIDILHELSALPSGDYVTARVEDTAYGFVVFLGDGEHIEDEIADAKARGLSDSYQNILRKASAGGAFLINIDEDGDMHNDIPISDD